MNEAIRQYVDKYEDQTKCRFEELDRLVCASIDTKLEEKLWAKLPSYYAGENFVRLIPFKDHINIEARAILSHVTELSGYQITPKGMLKIDHEQPIPAQVLRSIFRESLEG